MVYRKATSHFVTSLFVCVGVYGFALCHWLIEDAYCRYWFSVLSILGPEHHAAKIQNNHETPTKKCCFAQKLRLKSVMLLQKLRLKSVSYNRETIITRPQ